MLESIHKSLRYLMSSNLGEVLTVFLGVPMIDAHMWAGIVMALVTLLTIDLFIDLFLPGGLVEGHEDPTRARTAGFRVLVLAQLFNCLGSRSETRSAFRGLLANRWLWTTVALSAVLQVAVVHLGFLSRAFGTALLSLEQWGVCSGMASGVFGLSELRNRGYCTWAHGRRAVEPP